MNGLDENKLQYLNARALVANFGVATSALRGLNDGQKITYELVKDRKSGKMSADNLQT